MSRRFQARRANGRFTRNTLENCFGLHALICEHCRAINPYGVGEPAPKTCRHCGSELSVPTHQGDEE